MSDFSTAICVFGDTFNNALQLYDDILGGRDLCINEVNEVIKKLDQAYQMFCYSLATELGNEQDETVLYSYFETIRAELNAPRMFTDEFQNLSPVTADALKLQKALYRACGWCAIRNPYNALAGFAFRYEMCLIRGTYPQRKHPASIPNTYINKSSKIIEESTPAETSLSDILCDEDKQGLISRIAVEVKNPTARKIAIIIKALTNAQRLKETKVAPICRAFAATFNIQIRSVNVSLYLTGDRAHTISPQEIETIQTALMRT